VERLETVIREAATLALAGNERAVSFSLRIAPDAAWAFIDKVQIQQLLLNLMRNSVEALEGAVARRLDLLTTRNGDRIELRVSDSGPGLPAAVRARLFQPFVTTKAEGLGVGLSICRTIAQGHGGDLVLEDRQDGRTTFCFTVPSAGEEATLAAL